MNAIDQKKQEIVRDYCTNIAVVDDEAYDAKMTTVGSAYQKLVRECNNQSLLLHLQQYPSGEGSPTDDDFQEPFQRALKLAQATDALVLDWFLGLKGSPEHALELLKELSKSPKLQFVLIYTQNSTNVSDALEGIGFHNSRNSANTGQQVIEESDEPELEDGLSITPSNLPVFTTKARNVFVTILAKEIESGHEILDAVYQMILQAYPGLLPWAGLELVVQLKRIVPELLTSLPDGIDAEFALQSIFKEIPNEMAMQFSGLFLDEISSALKLTPPKIIHDDILESITLDEYRDLGLAKDKALSTVREAIRSHAHFFGSGKKNRKIKKEVSKNNKEIFQQFRIDFEKQESLNAFI